MDPNSFQEIGCIVATVSDTRTVETDKSGRFITDTLTEMGHRVVAHKIIPDEMSEIQNLVRTSMSNDEVSAVILTGGTGITDRDVTPDAVVQLATKTIPGFGELFRWLSYRDIGTSTIQSRTGAWLCGNTLVFSLPGSTSAVRLAMNEILVEQLDIRTRPCNFIQLLPRIGRSTSS